MAARRIARLDGCLDAPRGLKPPRSRSAACCSPIPPAVLALAFFFYEAPLALALAWRLLPRLFGTMRALLDDCYASPALLAARSRGVGPHRDRRVRARGRRARN